MKRNLKALLMKATESLGGAREGILSSINESLGRSHSIVVRDLVAWTKPA